MRMFAFIAELDENIENTHVCKVKMKKKRKWRHTQGLCRYMIEM